MGLLFSNAITPEDRIELVFHAQPTHNSHGEAVHLVTHHRATLAAKMLECITNARIKHGSVEQMHLVALKKDPRNFVEMIRVLLRQRMFKQMLHASTDVGINELCRQ